MEERRLTGSRVSYYLAPVKHPQREDQPAYVAECEDIIQALQMDFNEACEFKAIWRTAAARLGNGKPGSKALYDAEKRLHYAGRSVLVEKRRASDEVVEQFAHAQELSEDSRQRIAKLLSEGYQLQVEFFGDDFDTHRDLPVPLETFYAGEHQVVLFKPVA